MAETKGDHPIGDGEPGEHPNLEASAPQPPAYRVLSEGLEFEANGRRRRAKQGSRRRDIPTESIPWLLAQGHIEPIEGEGEPGDNSTPGEEMEV